MLSKAICRVRAIPVKAPKAFFAEIEETTLKFVWNHKRPQAAKAVLRKRDKCRGITLPSLKLHRITVVKIGHGYDTGTQVDTLASGPERAPRI